MLDRSTPNLFADDPAATHAVLAADADRTQAERSQDSQKQRPASRSRRAERARQRRRSARRPARWRNPLPRRAGRLWLRVRYLSAAVAATAFIAHTIFGGTTTAARPVGQASSTHPSITQPHVRSHHHSAARRPAGRRVALPAKESNRVPTRPAHQASSSATSGRQQPTGRSLARTRVHRSSGHSPVPRPHIASPTAIPVASVPAVTPSAARSTDLPASPVEAGRPASAPDATRQERQATAEFGFER